MRNYNKLLIISVPGQKIKLPPESGKDEVFPVGLRLGTYICTLQWRFCTVFRHEAVRIPGLHYITYTDLLVPAI